MQGSHEKGFTLVELMIVLALFGLMSAIVVVAMPDPRGRLRTDAERLAARILTVRDEAMIEGRDMRVLLDPLGYSFEARSGGAWAPLDQRALGRTEWAQGTRLAIGRDARGSVTFDSTGLASEAMAVRLFRSGEAVTVRIGQNGAVRVGE